MRDDVAMMDAVGDVMASIDVASPLIEVATTTTDLIVS